MKKLFYPLIFLAFYSCREKPASEADYMQRALKSDTYKVVLSNVKRVKDSLALIKNRPIDTNAVIYEYNTILPNSPIQVTTISQVEEEMKKDTELLKSVQVKIAAQLAKDHQDSISKVKP